MALLLINQNDVFLVFRLGDFPPPSLYCDCSFMDSSPIFFRVTYMPSSSLTWDL